MMATASVLVDEPIVDEIIMNEFEPKTTNILIAVTDRGPAVSGNSTSGKILTKKRNKITFRLQQRAVSSNL